MTYKVIDTIWYRKSWTFRYPEMAKRGDGLMVLLDPEQIRAAPEISGRTVTVRLPDGTVRRFVAAGSEAHHSTVGIFFGCNLHGHSAKLMARMVTAMG